MPPAVQPCSNFAMEGMMSITTFISIRMVFCNRKPLLLNWIHLRQPEDSVISVALSQVHFRAIATKK